MSLFDENAPVPAPRRRMSRASLAGLWAVSFSLVALLILTIVPTSFVIQRPGPVYDTLGSVSSGDGEQRPLISISGAETFPTSGTLDLLTVEVLGNRERTPSWLELAAAWFDPARAVVHVDGMRLQLDSSRVTLALNKPRGVVSTMHDPDGRPSIAELVADRPERLFHVGRLDADSEGLLLLTNDGELANHLAHPSHEVAKTYLVTVRGKVAGNVANKFLHGIELEDGVVQADAYRVVDQVADQTMIEVVLHSGRNRVVRRMFEEVGYPVTRLVRTRIGPIALGNLRPGTTRVLGRTELGTLMAGVGL